MPRPHLPIEILAVAALCVAACRAAPPARVTPRSPDANVDIRVVTDEADAALAILSKRRAGEAITEDDWRRLFASEGYRQLARREAAMGRAFTDSSFRAFLLADSMAARAPALAEALAAYRRLDVAAATRRALAYLPPGTRIRARLYPLVKPRPNSFVFPVDSVMGIFKFVDPAERAAVIENVLAHELHHVGVAAACRASPDSALPPAVRALVVRLGGFAEGLAMLAAAGGADVHPHATSDTANRNRWDRDVANVAADVARLESFFLDVLEGRIASADSVHRVAQTFYGVQGPWYTVGWVMGVAIERALGRERLISVMCDPRRTLTAYNEAAAALRAAGESLPGVGPLPSWSDRLLRGLGERR